MTIKTISDLREILLRAPRTLRVRRRLAVDRLAGLLPAEALEDALKGLEPEEITGPGGLLTQLAGRVIETALGAELTEHLGYPPGRRAAAARQRPQRVDGARPCTPIWGRSRSARRATATAASSLSWWASARPGWPGLDDKILGLYAGGMTVRDIAAHLSELYGVRDRARHHQPRHRRRAGGRRGVAHAAAGCASTRSSTSTRCS